jgi:predicted HTH transcriptional regulator
MARRYVELNESAVASIVSRGEGEHLEFKSTARTNLKTGKTDDAIILSWLKSIAGFLNSNGGTLIIGVGDDLKPVDDLLSVDNFSNTDKCYLFLTQRIRSALGSLAVDLITICPERLQDSRVFVIECRRSSEPIYCKMSKGTEEFFVRHGPQTNSLSISDAVRYITRRFQ